MLSVRFLLGLVFIGVVNGKAFRFGGVFSSHGETETMVEAGDGYALGIDAVNSLHGGKGFYLEGKEGTDGFYMRYEFFRRDDDSIEKKHWKEMKNLVDVDEVHFTGGSHPKYAEKEMRIANDLGRLNYHCCVGPDELYEKGLKYVFGIPVSNREYTKMWIRTLSLQNISSLVIVYENSNGFTETTCDAALQFADELRDVQASANEILNITFNNSTVTDDFYEEVVQKTKDRGIQAVIGCVFPAEGKKLVDAFHDQQYPLKAFFLTTGPTKKNWVESFRPRWRARDVFSAAQWHRDMKYPDPIFGDTQNYTIQYEKKYEGQHPTYNAAAASAVILTLTEAIQNAFKHCDISKTDGDADELLFNPEAIECDDDLGERGYDRVLRALKALDTETFFGRVKFNYYQRNDGLDPVTTQIQQKMNDNGTREYYIEAVLPLGFATKFMNFPASNPYKEDCKPGYFDNGNEFDPCVPCQPGEASHDAGAKHCDSCPIGEWTDKTAQSICSECPNGTHTEIRGASKLTDCMCKPGFFNVAEQLGVECEPCPVGAECPGGTKPPVPMPGFWANLTRREEIFECDPPSICKGGDNVECEKGHEGRLCSQCSEGFFSAMQSCFECLSKAAIVSLAIALLYFWYLINVVVSKRVASAEMILGWAQLANIIGDINLNWTRNVNRMFGVVNFLDFDVDILEPSCIIPWGFQQNMVTQLLLPFVMTTMAFLGYFASCVAFNILKRGWIRPDGKRFKALSPFVFIPENKEQLGEKWDVTIARFWSSVDVTYVTVAKYCLDVFKCEHVAGVSVLREDPSVVCAGKEYMHLRIIASIGIGLYVVGYLAFTIWKTFDLRNRRAFCDRVNILRYGFIYKKFENDYFFTPVLIIFRKLQFVLVLVFVNNPAFQLGFLALIIIASLIFQVYAAPYVDSSMDVLCSFLLIVLMLGAFAGLMFNSDNMPPGNRRILEWLVIGALMCMLVVFMVILANELNDKLMECRVRRRLRNHRRGDPPAGLIVGFIRRLSNQNYSQRSPRRSTSGVSHASSTHEIQINYELLETFDTRFVYRSLKRKPELVRQWDDLTCMLKDHVSDQSEMSYLSMLPEAKFWRRLVRAFPELVDFFAVTDELTREKFLDVLTTLFQDFYVAKKITKLPLMKTINWRDRAPMAFWLAYATPEEREFFVKLMTEMLQANNREAGFMLESMSKNKGFDPLLDDRQSRKVLLRRGRSCALLETYMDRSNPFRRLSSERSFHRSRTADSSTALMNREMNPERSSISAAPLTPTPSEVSMSRLQRDRTQGESSCSESPDVSVNQGSTAEYLRERPRKQTSYGSINNGKSVGFSDNV